MFIGAIIYGSIQYTMIIVLGNIYGISMVYLWHIYGISGSALSLIIALAAQSVYFLRQTG